MSEFDKEELERVLRKIKHCLALSASANEHEAATAMRQARKLMQKYRLSDLDVKLSDVTKTTSESARAYLPAWERDLATIVAQAFNCKAYTHGKWDDDAKGRRERSIFIGVAPAPEIAKYAFDTLRFKVSTARRDFMAQVRKGLMPRGRYTTETRGNHFAEAWVLMMHDKLKALVPDVDEQVAASDSKALILVQNQENELIEAYVKQLTNGAGAKTSKASNRSEPNLADLIAGMKAGKKAQISQGLYSGGTEALAIGAGGAY